jgi:hypothetical protein
LSGALSPRAAVKSILGILIMETHLESFSVFEHNNPDCPVQNTGDDEWEFAQAAFETARQLPVGAERFEALKKAGQLRYDADKKRNNRSGRRPVDPDAER